MKKPESKKVIVWCESQLEEGRKAGAAKFPDLEVEVIVCKTVGRMSDLKNKYPDAHVVPRRPPVIAKPTGPVTVLPPLPDKPSSQDRPVKKEQGPRKKPSVPRPGGFRSQPSRGPSRSRSFR